MNKKQELNRFGDTAFRISKQIPFYTQILLFINDNIQTTKELNLKEIINYCTKQGIINYKKSNFKREDMLVKQLLNFNLIIKENNYIKLTKFGIKVLELLEIFIKNKFSIEILWYWLMLNADANLSNLFSSFVLYLFDNNINKIEEELLISFICSNKSIFGKTKIMEVELSNEEINIILETGSIQSVAKRRKVLLLDKYVPKLIKNINNEKELIKLLNEQKEFKKIVDIYKYITKSKNKINKIDIINFIRNRDKKLIADAINFAHFSTINKDYKDINLRWFIEVNLFKRNKKDYFLNKELKDITYDILRIKTTENFKKEFENIILKYKNLTRNIDYPFNKKELIEILNLISNSNWDEVKSNFKLENISNSTLFEYFINYSFAWVNDINPTNFKNVFNTILDNELLPLSHAPGGMSDGVLIIENQEYSTIESTLLFELELLIKNERTSIQRHAVDLFKNKNKTPRVLFVLNKSPTKEIIYQFCHLQNSFYFKDSSIKVQIILLSIQEIINMVEKKYFYWNIEKYFPIKESKNEITTFIKYNQIMNLIK